MKVFKYGGASVKDAEGIKNLAEILTKYKEDNPLVVISAMGKTTNALEEVARAYYLNQDALGKLNYVKQFHFHILTELFDSCHSIYDTISNLFLEIEWAIEDTSRPNYSFEYDQIVSFGELLSTSIVSAYLKVIGVDNDLLDARDVVKTDNNHQEARIDWNLTSKLIKEKVNKDKLTITQGFIGCTSENFTTTLGREGSDYSAAVFATVLEAKKLVIWKDVPGVLHADPRYFENPKKIEKLSFQEAIELAFYGATVIHPKTLQPLKRNGIPLEVRSFVNFDEKGTWISDDSEIKPTTSFYILKKNQILLSISVSDLDFIVENHLSSAFLILAKYNAKVNLVQNSAVSCSFALDIDDLQINSLVHELSKHFIVSLDSGLDLLTLRHYKNEEIEQLLLGKNVLLTQKNRSTIQVLYKL